MTPHHAAFLPGNLCSTRPSALRRWRKHLASLLLLAASLNATAQNAEGDDAFDPPGRVARIGLIEGAVSHAPAGLDAWNAATLNRPLTTGDRLWVAERSRTELHIGSTAVRLNSESSLNVSVLDDDVTQLQLTQGTLSLRVRALFEGQRLQIDTPNLAFSVAEPGEYRIDVDPIRNTTRLSVLGGSGAAYGESGVPYPLGQRQQVTFAGSNLAQIAVSSVGLRDSFEAWVAERDRREDQLAAARYVSRETIGYQQLDDHGDWANDASYGNVWYPRSVASDWAPYRFGQWVSVAPWGWTWVDDAPWGFAPFHYGRWAYVGSRWGWVPGPLVQRPVYAPALVGFVGGGGVNVGFSIGSSNPGVGWFPLAPGEAWRPYHRVSPRYAQRVNRALSANNANAPYRHHRQPHAVTVVNRDTFIQGQSVGHNRYRARPDELARAEVVTGPHIAAPDRRNWRGPGRAAMPNAQPPGTVAQREALTDRAAAERAYFRRPAERDRDRNGDGRDDRDNRDGRAERNDRNDRNDNDGRFRAERQNNPADGANTPGRRAQEPLPGNNPLPPSVAQRWGQQRGADNGGSGSGTGDAASNPPRFVQTPGVPNLRNVTPNLRPITPNLNNPVDGIDDQRRAAQQRELRQNQFNEQAQRDAQRDAQRQAHEQRMQVQTQQLLQRQQQQAQQQQSVQAQQQLFQQQQQAEQRQQQMQQRQQRHPVNVQNTAPPNMQQQQQPQRGEDRRFGGPRGQGGNRDERR